MAQGQDGSPPRNVTRRWALGAAAAGAGFVLFGRGSGPRRPHRGTRTAHAAPQPRPVLPARPGLVEAENALPGDAGWQLGPKVSSDAVGQIKGYAAEAAVPVGGRVRLKVSVDTDQPFGVEVYRLGHYGGAGGRLVAKAEGVPGVRQAPARLDADDGTVVCDWADSWETEVPTSWTGGAYTAVLTNADGFRNHVPFTVTEPEREGDFLVVLPVTTYQAYNEYPMDGATGRSLYYGQDPATRKSNARLKARVVSFDRPYAGGGLPQLFDLDHAFVRWAESRGYDLVYATSVDLHAGRVDPTRYKALVFPGHDEYWSQEMRSHVERASAAGVGLVFLTANNIYWHVRVEPSASGVPHRLVRCHKDARSGSDRAAPGPTVRWRDLHLPEQGLLGVQYVSVVKGEHPLVVRESGHWFWSGTGLADGDALPGLVWGEADRRFDGLAEPRGTEAVFLSRSAYVDGHGRDQTQESSLYRAAGGGLVFTAGTFRWPQALGDPRFADPRVQRATANLFDRLRGA
ncbi:N,N-dimethylformamidase beta subunit family domain-containing protein [Yinghuangia seranimata]|uniref:N,N-dimethylformamidase beta subunit family domain-containing protein n=1 Tax=Yinghuangia seranimata TaxID=408067 RepID=UPI00248C0777|nr:N,N-dimethylformamidase beta subunit family domain-containing protein [Yinghuangia seranimata]MDI2128102.1 phosphoribosylamine--glycine ligase [Yinghuangia seranimata]